MMGAGILTVNVGSSSLKLGLFAGVEQYTTAKTQITITNIGQSTSRIEVATEGESRKIQQSVADHASAAAIALDELNSAGQLADVAGIGVRVVHGGERYHAPTVIDEELLAELHRLVSIDQQHMPLILEVIRIFRERLPGVVRVACFDTGFFHDIPQVAQTIPLPARYREKGLRRYGFHGLSYEYILESFRHIAGEQAANGRVVIAHLGSGASLAALKNGRPVDMTMGFSPVSGIPMSTRSGDIDPSAIVYLARMGVDIEEYSHIINTQSGLLGVSGLSADMLILLENEATHNGAREAVELFCYSARKAIGSLSAAIGGIDSLIFSGGMGENAPKIRARICQELAYLGIMLDESRNQDHLERISSDESRVGVHVIPTDESYILRRSVIQIMEMPYA